ncbi:mannose-6-phosphate isomerase, class I [Rhodoluna sp.]|uniref:mannose-6-phosphate isomerase, class I n=1 Tax=Rhodoluna sp. TaxID=1969481 RepID=UPI0025E00EE6|nr:mannose-6-phosphate isomerase, class I [Rhodoluna sp.]
MLVKIANTARDYAWGSHDLIPDYFGIPAKGGPMAEIWFGTHAGSPAFLVEEPDVTLVDKLGGHQLRFLLKILAAGSPLSIQAHPNSAQAAAGFERENAQGIPLNAKNRNYKDDRHKPEIVVALTDFEALCGFKSIKAIDELLEDFVSHSGVSEGFRTLSAHWKDLLHQENGLQKLFSDIIHRRGNLDGFNAELTALADGEAQFALAERLNLIYPGDPGVVVAMLMNHVRLKPNQALFLPAGNIHAYLGGLAVELMASSDNVLRGGLTPKHIDVDELERVIDFGAGELPRVEPIELSAGLTHYPCAVDDFLLYRVEPSGLRVLADMNLPGECVILCTAGEILVSDSLGEMLTLRRGEAAYLSETPTLFTVAGAGTGFIAVSPTR